MTNFIPKSWGVSVPPFIQDTREQWPLDLDAWPGGVKVDTLKFGDYGLEGFSGIDYPRIIFERKSLADIVGSLTYGRERFMKEVEALRRFQFSCIVIEAERAQLDNEDYRGITSSESLRQTLFAIMVRTGVHVHWAGNRANAAQSVMGMGRQFLRGLVKDVQRLPKIGRREKGSRRVVEG